MYQPYFSADDCDIEAFKALLAQQTRAGDVPFASEIIANVPIYEVAALDLTGPERPALMAEWARVMLRGAGAIVLRGAYAQTRVLDEATAIYTAIIAEEKAQGGSSADHFAAGTNDRVWNSLQKLCLADADVFARYFGNLAIDAASEAWLGPNYQMTAQVNLVYPGGAAQQAHRDYHLGFQTAEVSAAYPAHVHDLSPVMTLQGAVAHCDMPVESGPTKLLPFSQAYRAGYAAYRLPEFAEYFDANCVQVPLKKGDALFFSPALFHAAGANSTADVERMANLMQVGSAMGRTLENVDRLAMCKALYPVLSGTPVTPQVRAAVACAAEGYSFPTNLDRDPPVGGLVPQTQAALFLGALETGMPQSDLFAALDAQAARKRA